MHKDGNLIIGYTTRQHLLLDLDKSTVYKATRLAYTLMKEYPQLGDCLLMISSNTYKTVTYRINNTLIAHSRHPAQNIHLIFDNDVGYEYCCHIILTLAELGVIDAEYVHIREMRNDMTLRVSETHLTTGTKPKPKPVTYIRNPYSEKSDNKIIAYQTLYNYA